MENDGVLSLRKFCEVDLNDPFFDTLKADYPGFDGWFQRKGNERAFVFYGDDGSLQGFLYTKQEDDALTDIQPNLPPAHRLKVGTFKVNAHGTKLGERFMKKIFDIARAVKADEVYVTVFPKHAGLVSLLARYGFKKIATKQVGSAVEDVMSRSMISFGAAAIESYPLIRVTPQTRHFLLAIYPQWHTRLFPDSILNNEDASIVTDTSSTNSIHKVYITSIHGIEDLRVGDTIFIYRTAPQGRPAEYSSVVTSLCVVEEFRWLTSFRTVEEFLAYAMPYSVFTEVELREFFRTQRYTRVIRFSYNIALPHRIIRKVLIESIGLDRAAHWNFLPMTKQQFADKLNLGGVDARTIVYTP
jgi:hypothetical protein